MNTRFCLAPRLSSTTTRIKTPAEKAETYGHAIPPRLSSTTTRIKTETSAHQWQTDECLRDYLPQQQGLRQSRNGADAPAPRPPRLSSTTTRIKTCHNEAFHMFLPPLRDYLPQQQGLRHYFPLPQSSPPRLSETIFHNNKD